MANEFSLERHTKVVDGLIKSDQYILQYETPGFVTSGSIIIISAKQLSAVYDLIGERLKNI